ncbi:Mpt5p KNAG_0G01230 [Huiozyma naganishii CBS 8797]|uniref:PUM-HD domain-containing protein n=1 Tax=Huiozyma naganishii (strain ATCC MYA-139 / BCRC 22969 / CBS 8797 / KCTC 17520 / NBRC 10181 / NCYC 3082 / Yp74L-3) TaxID=1071383 RepID=J7S8Y5_HUIN7|nr:hypothetical protein KNAG_0G01230 [Kazachstania naganishii CBS 8797]CCK71181.1 hypothetical protein KNAG_0G01230 [Kazachstania naganishii CBS 8797]
MSYNHHQPQLSINSVQSLVEPVTPPPLGQMNNKKNHQKTQSLDLSGFNQFINAQSPLVPIDPTTSVLQLGIAPTASSYSSNLPLIDEFASSGNDGARAPTLASASASASAPTSKKSKATEKKARAGFVTDAKEGVPSMNEIMSTPLKDLDYAKLATDQFGCRFLQKKLESSSIEESNLVRDLMFEQVKPFLLNLILDPFGNYLIQKSCDFLTVDQRTVLIESIYQHVFKISINQYGTRSLQKIIDTVDNDQQINLIVKGFSPEFTPIEQVVTLINDLNGNHVIQKCIFKFPSSKFDFIINAIIKNNNIITISTHKHGCCVLQKLLSVCTLQQIFSISVKIIEFLPGLINDQFGNYIIQFLFDIKELDFFLLNEVFNKLANELCQLSCLKFSSNVVEKFIKKLFGIITGFMQGEYIPNVNDDIVNNTMNILLAIIDIFTTNLNVLIRDNFGNYALQTLLDVKNYNMMLDYPDNNSASFALAKHSAFCHDFTVKITALVAATKELLPSIKTTSYAKKIKLKVKAYSELAGVNVSDMQTTKPPAPNNVEAKATNQRNNPKSHQRHFSLPANAYHKRNGSVNKHQLTNVYQDVNQHSQTSMHQTNPSSTRGSMTNIFSFQNGSPLNFQQQQQQQAFTLSSPANGGVPNHYPPQQPNVDINLSVPMSNLSLSGAMPSQPSSQPSMFFLNDTSHIGHSSSSSTLYQTTPMMPSTSSGSIINDVNRSPNLNGMYSNMAFLSPNPNINAQGTDMNLFMTTPPQRQRIVSNPYIQPAPFNNDNTAGSGIGASMMFLGDDEFKNFNFR